MGSAYLLPTAGPVLAAVQSPSTQLLALRLRAAGPSITPTYTTPDQTSGTPYCPSLNWAPNSTAGSKDNANVEGISPLGTLAYGQSMAEDNPFDPLHTDTTCFPITDGQSWSAQVATGNTAPQPSWLTSTNAYQAYNLYIDPANPYADNYRPFNGRWVYLFVKIPDTYNALNYMPANNPAPYWWYVQYNTNSPYPFTDRTTWEITIIDAPPHLIR